MVSMQQKLQIDSKALWMLRARSPRLLPIAKYTKCLEEVWREVSSCEIGEKAGEVNGALMRFFVGSLMFSSFKKKSRVLSISTAGDLAR